MPNAKNKKDYGDILMSWKVEEFEKHNRSKTWYISIFIIGGALLIYSIAAANFLFAVIIVMIGIVSLLSSTREPGQLNFSIHEDGIEHGTQFYLYKELKNFWIIYEPPEIKSLYIDFKSALRPHLTIPLKTKNPVDVRRTLLKYIDEDATKEEEPFSDALGRMLKL
ncbi:MAG: hypothetical protein ACE5D7_07485 [Fidelibacterota bacterium]